MRFLPGRRNRQGGAALLVLLAVISLGGSWYLVSRLNAESGSAAAVRKQRDAEVLNRAKQALIGYVAAQAANAGEDNPGALPCPEAAGYFDNPGQEGQTASGCTLPRVGRFPWRTIGTEKLLDSAGEPLWYVVSPGWARTSGNTNINSNSIGRLTVDGAATTPVASPGNVNFTAHGLIAGDAVSFTTGGTLPTGITAGTTYYVIATGLTANAFRIASVPAGSAINFTGTSSGSHNVHRNPLGTGDSVVALIIAPGPAFSVPACGAIPAKVQQRPIVDPLDGNPFPDLRNYLECENATAPTPDATFVTSGPSGSFNDQVMRVTVADIMPGIEAAVAKRIERDIVPTMKTVYTSVQWGSGISATTPMFPFAAPWSTSTYGPGPGTVALPSSNYRGTSGTYQGLLPFNQTQGCTESVADPRCTTATTGGTAFLVFSKFGNDVQTGGAGSIRTQSSCAWQANVYVCTGEYNQPTVSLSFTLNVTNVAMGLRTRDLTRVTCTAVDDVGAGLPTQNVPCSATVALQADGSARVTVTTNLMPDIVGSGWGTYANYNIRVERAVFGDHALLDSANATTGWFVRNEWYRLIYYATAQSHTAAQLPGALACAPGANCLTVTNLTPSNNKRSLLLLAGRSLTGATRPNGTLSDFLEFANADLDTVFEKQPIRNGSDAAAKKPFNDRVVVLD